MKAPDRNIYEKELEATRQSPQEFLRSAAEERFETKLLTDPWYVWPVLGALTTAWVANVAFRWPVNGASALLEVAAFSGLAARLVSSHRGGYARYSLLFLLWGVLAGIGTSTGGVTSLICWLAGGFALVVFTLLVGPRTRAPLGWLVLIVCALPWMPGHTLPWSIKLAQTILAFSASGVVLALSGREVRGHPVWIWQRIALAGWVILVFHPPAALNAFSTLAPAVAGLIAVFTLERWLQRPRTFIVLVALWATLHLLGLRSVDGSLAVRLTLSVSGFLLLVVAGWRFGESSLIRWWQSIYINSPRCLVPRLDRSSDYPLKIDVA